MEATTVDQQVNYIKSIGTKNYFVNETTGRISYLDARFYQVRDGVYVPSVTTILEAYPKGAAFAEWLKKNGQDSDEIRDEAGRRGSVVHKLTETFDLGGKLTLMDPDGDPQYKISEWSMLERFVEFRKNHPATIHAIEANMISEELGYAGTLDRVLTIDGTTYLMDIKTGTAVHTAHWLQQAAYLRLLNTTGTIAKLFPDGPVPEIKLAILHLNAKTRSYGKGGAIQGPGWQFIPQERETTELLRLFNCVKALWMEENGTQAPKLTSYSLEHQLNTQIK